MKKILTLIFAIAIFAALSLNAFAATGSSSPLAHTAPELISAVIDSDVCEAEFSVISYAERRSLPATKEAAFDTAYAEVVAAEDLTALGECVTDLAEYLNVDASALAVSDFFYAGYADCVFHVVHGIYTVTIAPDSVENYAGLLQYGAEGWTLLDSSVVDGTIVFEIAEGSPLAIVVHDGTGAPDKDSNVGVIVAAVAVPSTLAIAAAAYLIYKRVKKSKV